MRILLAIVVGTLTGLLPASPAASATFTVDTTSDSAGLTGCTATPNDCSLRGAIARATAVIDADLIAFDIPPGDSGCTAATGVCRIQVAADLSITQATVIDGYTQPGATPNTIPAPGANNAQLKIEVSNAPGFNSFRLLGGSGALTLRGVAMFLPSGGMISGARSRFVIQGNWFGVSAAGTSPDYSGNGHVLDLSVCVASEVLIGGPNPADRNVIAGSGRDVDGLPGGGSASVCADGGTLRVEGNLIGLAPDGLTPLPLRDPFQIRTASATPTIDFVDNRLVRPIRNFSGGFGGGLRFSVSNVMDQTARIQSNVFGLAVDGTRIGVERDHIFLDAGNSTNVHRVLVGGTGAGQGNVFAAGIAQPANSPALGSVALIQNGLTLSRIEMVGNTLLGNDGIGLDFPHPTAGGGVALGRTANDAGDGDSGSNRMQNFPEISSYSLAGAQVDLAYRVDSTPAASAYPLRVDFYKALGDEGEVLLASDSYTAGEAQTIKPFSFTPPAGISLGTSDVIVAVATDAEGRSSEFGFHVLESFSLVSVTPATVAAGLPYVVRARVVAAATAFRPNGTVQVSDGRGGRCELTLAPVAAARTSEGECVLATSGNPGSVQLTLSYDSLRGAFARADATPPPPVTSNLTLTAGVQTLERVSGTHQSASVGAAFAAPLRVRALGAGGVPVAGARVSFAAPASGPTATLAATSMLTDAEGFAQTTATAGALAGSYLASARIGGLSRDFSLNNDPASGSRCTAVRSSELRLRDDFLASGLDPVRWTAFANDGAISVADGQALVQAGAVSAFPFVSARVNPIPANGSYSVRWVATYLETSATQRNHTLATTRGLPVNGSAPAGSTFHAAAGQDPAAGYRVTDVIPGEGAAFTSNPPQLVRREVEYCWLDGRNELWVDGVLRAAVNRDVALLRPDALWFGNPEASAGSGEHADFRLDLVEVRTLETGFDVDLQIQGHTPDPSPPGAAVTVSVALNPEAGAPAAPSGSVRISANTGEDCSIVLPATSCALSFATLGQRQIQAFYPGDAVFRSSKAVFVDHTVANPPALTIADASLTEGNSGTAAMSFVVSLANATGAAVSVDFATAPGTATAPADFIATGGTLNFVGGSTTQTIEVAIVGDTVVEPDETFSVALANASGAVIADSNATGTIRNDDEPPPPVLSIADATVQEPVSSGLTEVLARFAVSLDRASTQPVGVRVRTASGTAGEGVDFDANDFVLEFAPGQTSATVQVRVRDDALVEAAEGFTVTLSAPQGATLGDAEASGTILDGSADATLVVNSSADPGDGVCNASECTLREAILVANGLEAVSISFAIPGAGPHTIRPLTPLPLPGRAIHTIDGYTQPGSSPNTIRIDEGARSNAVIRIELDGSALGEGTVGLSILHGMTVRGLAIHSWRSNGIQATAQRSGRPTRIVGNFIGTAADGITARGNGGPASQCPGCTGIGITLDALIDGAIEEVVIGGDGPDRNVISANLGNGVTIGPGSQPDARVRVEGNLIGLGAHGEALGNRSFGLLVAQPNVNNGFNLTAKSNVLVANGEGIVLTRVFSGSTPTSRGQIRIDDNWVGLTPDGRSLPNIDGGISVGGPVTAVRRARLVGNRIGAHPGGTPVRLFNDAGGPGGSGSGNLALIVPAELPAGGTPIDLGSSGPTPNDPGDGDNGANFLLNTPVLLGASFNDRGDRLRVSYQIDTPALARRVAHFYRRDGERLLYLGEDGYTGGTDTAELVLETPIGNGTEIYALTELQAEIAVSSELSAVPVTVQARQAQASARPAREASGAVLRYTVQMDPPPASAVTLRYRSVAGSAQPASDFTPVSGQLTLSPASPTATVDVPLLNDSLVEADEGLLLEVDAAGDFSIGSAFAEGTIVDDDLLPQDQGQFTPLALDSLDGRNGFRIDHPRGSSAALVDLGQFDGMGGRDLAIGVGASAEGPAALHLLPNLAPPFSASLALPSEGSAAFPRWVDELALGGGEFPAALGAFRGAGSLDSLALRRGSSLLLLHGRNGPLPASATLGSLLVAPEGFSIAAFRSRRAIAIGDVNGDQRGDLALLGVDGDIAVVLGQPAGTPPPTSLSQLDGSNGFRYFRATNSRLVALHAVGDLNSDGFDDVIVRDERFDGSASVHFVRGRASFAALVGLPVGVGERFPPELSLRFMQYAGGDLDGDGHGDLVIGNSAAVGHVQVRFGDGTVPGLTGGSRVTQVSQAFPGDRIGSTLAVLPDINADGRADLAIGLPGADQPQTGAGQVALMYGRSNWPTNINLANPPADSVRFLAGRLQARVGSHLAALGDLNGDGLGELAVGTAAGRSYVVFSSDAIFRASAEARPQVPASGSVYESSGGSGETRLVAPAGSGRETLPVGDLDGDGRGDLLFARRGFDRSEAIALLPGSVLASAGATLDLGAALPAGATSFRRAAQGEQLSTREHAGDGDFNGDGRDDLAFLSGDGARVALVFGRAGGLPAFVDPFDGAAGTRQFELGASDGLRLAFLGDTDGDGFDELGVQRGQGQVDVFYGNASGTPRRSSLTAPAALQPIDLSPQARLGRIRSGGVPADSFAIGLDDGSHAVVFGNAAGLPATLDLSALGGAGTYLRTPGSSVSRRIAGMPVGTGDLDGDGIDDVAIGYKPLAADGSPAIAVALLRGRAGWPAEIDVSSADPGLVQGRILLRDLAAEPLTGIGGLRDRNADGRRELLFSLGAAEGHDEPSGKALVVHGFALPAGVQTQLEIEDLVPPGRGLTLRGALQRSDGTLANGQSLGDFDGDGRDDLVFGASSRQAGSNAFPNAARTFVVRGLALPQ